MTPSNPSPMPGLHLTSKGEGGVKWTAELVSGRHCFRVEALEDGFKGTLRLEMILKKRGEPWFLFPGFFYGRGRDDDTLTYPSLGDVREDDPWVSPEWHFALDRGSHPILLCRMEDRWQGLDWDPHYEGSEGADAWGECEPQIGLGFKEGDDEVGLFLNLPANEGPIRHSRNQHRQATEKVMCLEAGQCITFSVKQWDFKGDAHGYQVVVEEVYHRLSEVEQAPPLQPVAEVVDAAVAGLLNWHWVSKSGDRPGYMVYTAAYDRSAEFNANNRGISLGWHFEALGFVGGFPVAFGLLSSGGEKARDVAEESLRRFCTEGQSEWGFFMGSYHPGKARTANGELSNGAGLGAFNDDPSGETPFYGACWQSRQENIHARTTADATFYLFKCLAHLEGELRDLTLAAGVRSLEAALEVQDETGRFGQIYNVVKRKVHRSEGGGGLLWIPAMAAALEHVEPELRYRLEGAMEKAGEGYAPDVEREYLCGAPEDVSLAPTSEDGYNAVMAYAALYRLNPQQRWLDLWIQSTEWTLTWRKAYNVRFSKRNVLSVNDFRTVGGDFASSNNNHLHVYGMNCLGDLLELSEITGKAFYRHRALDHFRFTCQLLVMEDGQWNGQRGMATEQFYTSDWSIWDSWDPTAAHVQKGTFMGFSHVWCINMVLLGVDEMKRAGMDLLD